MQGDIDKYKRELRALIEARIQIVQQQLGGVDEKAVVDLERKRYLLGKKDAYQSIIEQLK
jgi:hypothetical protein